MCWIMLGCGAAVVIGSFLPWIESGVSGDTLGGVDWGPGQLTIATGLVLCLYAAQGLVGVRERVRYHGAAIAAIVITILQGARASNSLDEADSSVLGAAQLEIGTGLALVALASFVAIWPLVVLRRQEKAQEGPPEATQAPAKPKPESAATKKAGAGASEAKPGPPREVRPLAERIPELEGWRRWILPGLGAAVIAAGAIVIWEAVTGDDETQTAAAGEGARSLDSILGGSDAGETTTESGGFFPEESSAPPSEPSAPEPSAPEPSASAASALPDFEPHSSSQGGWSAEIPAGDGWSSPSPESLSGGAILRTTLRGPNGTILIVDATPSEAPVFKRSAISRSAVSHPAFAGAEEVVFTGDSPIAECNSGECVDYLLPDGSGGYAVLAGGDDFDYAREVAMHVMETLRPGGG